SGSSRSPRRRRRDCASYCTRSGPRIASSTSKPRDRCRVGGVAPASSRGAVPPQRPADRELYVQALGSLSVEALRTRFFAARRPPDAVVERLTHIDYIDHVAWVANDAAVPPAGIGRFIVSAEDSAKAEIALGILDAYQGK